MDDGNSNQDCADDKVDDVEEHNEEMEAAADEKPHGVLCGQRIITEIIKQNKTTCWPFMEPVDTEGLGLWDYELKIKEPMWLNKILQNIDDNLYSSFVEIATDFRKMIENCYRYNTTDHPISKKAKRLEMFFESKLGLLSREIQDSATIAKTSNGRFATKVNSKSSLDSDSSIAKPAGLPNGIRDFNGIDFNNQPHLVFDFVRCEEAVMAEDEKQASYRERKQQQLLYQQVAAVFVNGLETPDNMKKIKCCPVLPEIGLFMHVNEALLKLPELSMYNLEMGLLIPNDSLYLSKVMTSFLCTYYERNLINQRPPMTYSVWNRRLKLKLIKWFEVVMKHLSFDVAAEKLCLSTNFFKSMSWTNPFASDCDSNKLFHDLTFHQRAHIIKALCDSQTSTQSVQNTITALPGEQLRPMDLGEDVEGNVYIYFPQFCGDDIRVYRQRQFGNFAFNECPLPEASVITVVDNNHVKEQKGETSVSEDVCSPVVSDEVHGETMENTVSDSIKNVCDNVEGVCVDDTSSTAMDINQTLLDNCVSSNCEKQKTGNPSCEDVKPSETTSNKIPSASLEKENVENVKLLQDTEAQEEDSVLASPLSQVKMETGEGDMEDDDGKDSVVSDSCASQDEVTTVIKDEDIDVLYSPKPRKKRGKPKQQASPEPFQGVRRSSRKRTAVNYSKMMVEGEVQEEKKPKTSNTPRKRGRKSLGKKFKPTQIEEPVSDFGSVDFEMVCDSISALHDLISTIDEERSNAVKVKKPTVIIRNVTSLLERLRWLLNELLPFETKLEKARFDAKIRLKKEHDELVHKATTGNAFNSADFRGDPWEEEISNKNALISFENSSTRSGTPNPLYLEESDSESDRELRRSRRKPKRYEEDEDYVCESSDDELSPSLPASHLYDENDEERKRVMPAALDELEEVLTSNVTALKRIVTRERQDDELEGGAIALNERRTRQRSKRENKVFRKILSLASKQRLVVGPSLLPLIRCDQSEITEVVDRVLAKDAVARQQRKAAREQEEKKRRAAQLALGQQKRERRLQASKERMRLAKEEAAEANVNEVSSPTKRSSLLAESPAYRVQENETVENVIIRLQNGKVCPALRFNDGRIAPIVRVDNDTKPAASFEDLTSGFGRNKAQNAENKVPYISLTGNRRRTMASILRKSTPKKQRPAVVTSSSAESGVHAEGLSANAAREGPVGVSVQPVSSSNPISVKLVQRSGGSTSAVSTSTPINKPTGQLINLVLSSQATAQQPVTAPSTGNIGNSANPAGVGSLGKFVVKVNPRVLSIARPVVSQQTPAVQGPATNAPSSTVQSIALKGPPPLRTAPVSLPADAASAAIVQPQALSHAQTNFVPGSALASTGAVSTVQPRVHVVPAIVAAPVPVVQPVHLVQTASPAQAVALPVQPRPLLLVSQTRQVAAAPAYPAAAPPTTQQQTPRYVFTPYSQSGGS